MFKRLFTTLALGLILCALTLTSSRASDATRRTFGLAGTAMGTTNSYAVVQADGIGRPMITYLSATSDKSNSVVQFWRANSGAIPLTLATNASQAVVWCVGTNFSANDTILLRHVSAETYERLVCSSSTTTNLTFSANIATAVVAGDLLYKMTASGAIPVGNATKEVVTSAGLYHAPAGLPVLLEVDSTSAGKLNCVSGYFQRLD